MRRAPYLGKVYEKPNKIFAVSLVLVSLVLLFLLFIFIYQSRRALVVTR